MRFRSLLSAILVTAIQPDNANAGGHPFEWSEAPTKVRPALGDNFRQIGGLLHHLARPALAGVEPRVEGRRMKYLIVAGLGLTACQANQPTERYGFIARLGRDTVSVESVTRRGNTVTSDAVD